MCYAVQRAVLKTVGAFCPGKWYNIRGFFRRFRDTIRVPRISNRVPRITENYHRVPKIRENRVPRIREIGSLQIHIGYLTFSLKKTCNIYNHLDETRVFYAVPLKPVDENLSIVQQLTTMDFYSEK